MKALDGVSIAFRPGEIHAICGENGAGKSTLLGILSGNLRPDSGELLMDGEKIFFNTAADAMSKGIGIVHQHLSLIDALSVAENMFGNAPPTGKFGLIRRNEMLTRAGEWLKKLGLDTIRPDQLAGTLRPGEKQLVELAKAVMQNPRIVFLDEPTASLSGEDVERVIRILIQLKQEAVALVYISHRMPEIVRLADRITVLKDGRVQGCFPIGEINEETLIRLMVGREVKPGIKTAPGQGKALLELQHFSGPGFQDINFVLHAGEVLGLGGLVGAGRSEIARALFGAEKKTSGKMILRQQPIPLFRDPLAAIRAGIGFIPEDRKAQGIFASQSVDENIYVTRLSDGAGFRLRSMSEISRKWCGLLQVRTASLEKNAGLLSGGNQQKLLFARWLAMNPEILILDEPTHGVDIGARFEIYSRIREFTAAGGAVLLISSELTELLFLTDRIMVISGGTCTATLETRDCTEEQIITAAVRRPIAEIS